MALHAAPADRSTTGDTVSQPMHAQRRRREQGAAAALTVRPVLPTAEARRRSMAAHPSGAHRRVPLAPVVRLPARSADAR